MSADNIESIVFKFLIHPVIFKKMNADQNSFQNCETKLIQYLEKSEANPQDAYDTPQLDKLFEDLVDDPHFNAEVGKYISKLCSVFESESLKQQKEVYDQAVINFYKQLLKQLRGSLKSKFRLTSQLKSISFFCQIAKFAFKRIERKWICQRKRINPGDFSSNEQILKMPSPCSSRVDVIIFLTEEDPEKNLRVWLENLPRSHYKILKLLRHGHDSDKISEILNLKIATVDHYLHAMQVSYKSHLISYFGEEWQDCFIKVATNPFVAAALSMWPSVIKMDKSICRPGRMRRRGKSAAKAA